MPAADVLIPQTVALECPPLSRWWWRRRSPGSGREPLRRKPSERWGSGGSSSRASCPALSYSVVSLEGAVRYGGSNLQHHMRSPRRPAHLLIRGHPAMKQPLHGAFRRRRRYWLRVVTRRRVVDDHCRLPGHVRLQATQECTHLGHRRACSRPHRGDGIERRHGIADQIKCMLHLAVPQAPRDVLHSIGEEGPSCRSLLVMSAQPLTAWATCWMRIARWNQSST